jgi:hypothetical protein
MLVVDLNDPVNVDHVAAICDRLDQRKVTGRAVADRGRPRGSGALAGGGRANEERADDEPDPFRILLAHPAHRSANKSDLYPDPEEVRVLQELLGVRFPSAAVSARTGAGLDEIGPRLFEGLGIVRVYTKAPGRSADTGRPYTVRRGDTVLDVARLVHKEIAESLRFARVGGSGQFDGPQVGADHLVMDQDIVELHG